METVPWIGFDLDGSLAKYDVWRGVEHVGEPIKPMIDLAKSYLKEGWTLKVMTARVCRRGTLEGDKEREKATVAIQAWCKKHIGKVLEVTNEKDFGMVILIDDRAVQLETNTGKIIGNLPELGPCKEE
jgi:hypothetical protein